MITRIKLTMLTLCLMYAAPMFFMVYPLILEYINAHHANPALEAFAIWTMAVTIFGSMYGIALVIIAELEGKL